LAQWEKGRVAHGIGYVGLWIFIVATAKLLILLRNPVPETGWRMWF
jgi:hypothetical protein